MFVSNKILDKDNAQKACINCGQVYCKNRARYGKDLHRIIFPTCGN
ncbi:MAG: hypothetical protein L0H55_05660 [Candidatus Nitrosocosmicus sp.]|nr:hypothetical protein [Candidatus Nitrosocosmicus sp.]